MISKVQRAINRFNLVMTIATASFKTLSPNTKAYKLTSTCKSLKIAKIVTEKPKKKYVENIIHELHPKRNKWFTLPGSVAEMRAPKYRQSVNVKVSFGSKRRKPYMIPLSEKATTLNSSYLQMEKTKRRKHSQWNTDPTTKHEIVVPINANEKIAPKFLKKYFCKKKSQFRVKG